MDLNRKALRLSEVPVSPNIPMLYHPIMTIQTTTIVATDGVSDVLFLCQMLSSLLFNISHMLKSGK